VLVGLPSLRAFISPTFTRPKTQRWIKLVEIEQMEPGAPVRFDFVETVSDAWVEARAQRGVWIVTDDGKNFTVYNGHCTHLACSYGFDQAKGIFHCPCHHGLFDPKTGKVMGGPPRARSIGSRPRSRTVSYTPPIATSGPGFLRRSRSLEEQAWGASPGGLIIASARKALLDREVPDRLTWWHTLGSATLTVFVVQVVTGVVLATFYSPSPDHAYDSIGYIEREVMSGSLVRGIHHWAASAMVVLLVAHMIRVFAMGAYKYPREPNWLLGVAIFILVMAFGFTGYLLPWDEKAYWATQVGTSLGGTTPLIGSQLVLLLRGGGELGAATLTRFYAFHVLWLPILLGVLILLHLVIVVRQGIAPRTRALEEGAPARTTDPGYPRYYSEAYRATKRGGVRFYPDIIGKDAIVAALLITVIVLLALTMEHRWSRRPIRLIRHTFHVRNGTSCRCFSS
jgi:nitrite reductase/ring-hydroxylating ferredoxin subunit